MTSERTHRSYHKLSGEALHSRVYDVYRDLGDWLAAKTDAKLGAWYLAPVGGAAPRA